MFVACWYYMAGWGAYVIHGAVAAKIYLLPSPNLPYDSPHPQTNPPCLPILFPPSPTPHPQITMPGDAAKPLLCGWGHL